ncbi:hypothetical protein [Streptomyces sp. SID13031]|uniref:hypothetical protein n=1 Tax=Streptomyces sp. SID13031 TaxID=2706046 RepID=UPI0013CD01F5|nr:hypothetical protein [Streptomyces sp. SID13031]NEA30680.1 hypothetical protein [Streptomyces sp. SID13031]
MAGTGSGRSGKRGSQRRWEYFVGERLAGGPDGPVGFAPTDRIAEPGADIETRLAQLRAYRELQHEALAETTQPVGLVAVPGGPNWVPIGPLGAVSGQAAPKPVVSGRVQDIAISLDGQRVYLATANGGVWRTGDAGRTWEAMSDELDALEVPIPPGPVVPPLRQVDTLATGAIAMVDGGDAAHDRLYVGTGEGHAGFGTGPSTDFFGVGMLRSDDGGRTWAQEAAAPSLLGRTVYALATDPTDREHVLVATNVGVFRRTQATAGTATPWVEEPLPVIGAGNQVTSVAVGKVAGQVRFYAVVQNGAAFEWRPGAGWAALPALPAGSSRSSLAASGSDPVVVYALSTTPVTRPSPNQLKGGILHGVHRIDPSVVAPAWSTVSGVPGDVFGSDEPGQGNYDQAISVDPNDQNVLYIGGSGKTTEGEFSATVYRLEVSAAGGGFSCRDIYIGASSHADVHALTHRPGSSSDLWIGCDGGVFATTNARGTGSRLFRSCNAGLGTLTLMGLGHLPGEDSYAFCGAQDNGGLRYLGSEVWDHQLYGDGGDTVVDWAPAGSGTKRRLLSIYHDAAVRRSDLDGARYDTSSVDPSPTGQLFYPPMVGAPPSAIPGDSQVVAFGGEVPYVSETFGGNWKRLPARTPVTPAGAFVRSLAFASPTRLYAGWTDGHVARYDKTAAGWTALDLPRIGETRPVTGIAINPSIPLGQGIFVTLGGRTGAGARVWSLDTRVPPPPPPPLVWPWVAVGAGLLDVQHNAIVLDPADPTGSRRWVAADLGVWSWNAGAAAWQVLSANLPDAAVLDLDLVSDPTVPAAPTLLRATTYGRGVFELDLSGAPQPAISLVLRATPADRGRPARVGAALPGDHNRTTTADASPDIVVDAPDQNGRYVLDGVATPNLVELRNLDGKREVLASVPAAPATTRVHVTVRNRGVSPGNPPADGVRVALLVGPAGADDVTPPTALPAGYTAAVRDGTPIDAGGWKTVGIRTVDGIRPGKPGVATFNLVSDLLPPVDVADGQRFVLLALVHHATDPFPAAASQNPVTLVTGEPRAAMRRVTAVPARGLAASSGTGGGAQLNPPGGTGLLVPLTTALLAHQRLGDLADQLGRKVNSSRVSPAFGGYTVPVRPHPVERRVLAMATAARANMAGGPAATVPRTLPGAGIGQYALLGALGFELPGFTSVLAPGGGWVSDLMRRGTPDPYRSRVAVPASEFPLAMARAGLAVAGADAAAAAAVRGFGSGMLAAAAAGVMVGPQLAELRARDTNADWHRHSQSAGAAAAERYLRRRFLGGEAVPAPLIDWLPTAKSVPTAVWDGYLRALSDVYGLPAQRALGFPLFEEGLDTGDWLTSVRMRNAYNLVLDDLRTSSWPAPAWWGLLSPILLAPSISMLAARTLPNAGLFFAPGSVTPRSVFELLAVSMGIGSVAPFVYSMILWSAVDEHTEVFVTSLIMFLARAGIVTGALATSGDTTQSATTQWLGMFAPLASLDLYALIRSLVAGSRRPGDSTVFAIQTIPALTGGLTLLVSGLMKALGISTGWPFWLVWSLFTAAMWLLVGIILSISLSNGGGWQSWFLRSDRHFPLLSSVAAAGLLPPEPAALARVFDDSTLWSDPNTAVPADLSGHDYPSGMRDLITVWWEGAGTLEVRHGDDLVTFRTGGVETPVRLPAGTTAASLAQLLPAALAGVKAAARTTKAPDPALPWPRSLADPGDPGPAADAAVAKATFVPVGKTQKTGVVLRHAPRADLSTSAGLVSADAFPVVPVASLGDLEGSGLGAAADLATLLAVAAAPAFGPVTVADGVLPALPIPAVGEAVQVFRRWNLDERRLAEWQTLVSGGAPPDGAPVAAPDPLVRTPPIGYAGAQPVGADLVAAMGWIPLWRAWIRVATDAQADAASPLPLASTPLVRFPDGSVRRPTNAELTEGVRYLLDLGAV